MVLKTEKPGVSVRIPKSLAAAADLFYKTRDERYAKARELKKLEEKEALLKEHLIQNLKKGETTGVRGKVASVWVDSEDKYVAEEWPKLYPYIKKKNAFELFQRRLNETAVKEHIAMNKGKLLPGLGKIQVPKLHVSKVK